MAPLFQVTLMVIVCVNCLSNPDPVDDSLCGDALLQARSHREALSSRQELSEEPASNSTVGRESAEAHEELSEGKPNRQLLEVLANSSKASAGNMQLGICPNMRRDNGQGTIITGIRSRNECVWMGGTPLDPGHHWINCELKMCLADEARWFPAGVHTCRNTGGFGGYAVFGMKAGDCRNLLGRTNSYEQDFTWVHCHLDYCERNTGDRQHVVGSRHAAGDDCKEVAHVTSTIWDCSRMQGECGARWDNKCLCHFKFCDFTPKYNVDCNRPHSITAYWRPIDHYQSVHTRTVTQMRQVTASEARMAAKEFTEGVEMQVQSDMSVEVGPVGASMSMALTTSSSHTIQQAIEKTRDTLDGSTTGVTYEIGPGTVWRFQLSTNDRCGRGELWLGASSTVVTTPNNDKPPCCLPGDFEDAAVPHGSCTAASMGECYKFCGKEACDHFHRLRCPAPFMQNGAYGAVINGCGLDPCNARQYYTSIERCAEDCNDRADCKSFTYFPGGGGLCSLFGTTEKTDQGTSDQILCVKTTTTTTRWR